jgi:uncharacterized protein (TIGR03067 family)
MSFLLATTLCALVPLPEAPKPKSGFEGTWQIQMMVAQGVPFPVPADTVVVFRDGKAFKTIDGKEVESGTYALDPKAKPPTLDTVEMTGTKLTGIYAVFGDELRICIAIDGGARPTEFTSTAESKTVLMVFKRVKP